MYNYLIYYTYMLTVIPISKFQRQTKEAFKEVNKVAYAYVTCNSKMIAVVVSVKLFEKMEKSYIREMSKLKNTKI